MGLFALKGYKIGEINIRTETITDLIDGIEGNSKGVMHFSVATLAIGIETNGSPEKIKRLAAMSEGPLPG